MRKFRLRGVRVTPALVLSMIALFASLSTTSYAGGRMCYRFEEPLHRFQNMVVDRMVGIDRIPAGDADEQVPMFPEPQPAR